MSSHLSDLLLPQIDNPVSLMNQDTSRNFLRSSNPEANYKLFMRATHLEQIARDYEAAQEEQRLMREKNRLKTSVCYLLKLFCGL